MCVKQFYVSKNISFSYKNKKNNFSVIILMLKNTKNMCVKNIIVISLKNLLNCFDKKCVLNIMSVKNSRVNIFDTKSINTGFLTLLF